MQLQFDPGAGTAFWEAIQQIPGYSSDEVIPLRTLIFESGALLRLPTLLQELESNLESESDRSVLMVMDPTPMYRCGESLKPLVRQVLENAGRTTDVLCLFPDTSGQVHTTMTQVERVKAQLNPGTIVVAIGSGTISDISKHACYCFEQETGVHLPLVLYQTANSVSAFTSNMAPVFVNGVKRTLPSRYPNALVCDLETLRDAPYELTVAGVGDIMAAFVSFPDWYLAHCLGMDDGYSELPRLLMGPLLQIFVEIAPAIAERSLDGMAVLAKLIALGGLAMSLSHATTPLSGFEHVISHVLDLLAERANRPLALHGSQIALTTVLGASTYQQFLSQFQPAQVEIEQCFPTRDTMLQQIEQKFAGLDPSGHVALECWSEYRLKLEKWHQQSEMLSQFLDDWDNIRLTLQALTCPPEQIVSILRTIQAPTAIEEMVPTLTADDLKFAFLNAPLIRKRMTLGDLLLFLNWEREALWQQSRAWVCSPPSPPVGVSS